MAAPIRQRRANVREWFHTVRPVLQAQFELWATNVRDNLVVAAWPPPAPAVVTSQIRDAVGAAVANGVYNPANGIHAEIAAISNLAGVVGPANWAGPHTIQTSLEPCQRCALILRTFVLTYGWTVQAPANAFANNYPGAYNLPDDVYTVVAGQLGLIPAHERVHYEARIKSMICGFAVA